MTNTITENFEGLTPPAVPAGSFADFETVAGIGVSGSKALRLKLDKTFGRGEFAVSSGSADIDYSADIQLTTLSSTDGANSDTNIKLYYRSTPISDGSWNCYQLFIRGLWSSDAGTMASSNGIRLIRMIGGAETTVAGPVLPVGFSGGVFNRPRVVAVGNNHKIYYQRKTDNFYVRPDGGYQSGIIACIDYTDTTGDAIPGSISSKVGWLAAKSTNTSASFIMDNVTLDTVGGVVPAFVINAPANVFAAVGVDSGNFTVIPNSNYTGTITLSDGGKGGTFTPATLSWTGDAAAKTFKYKPSAIGPKILSAVSNPVIGTPDPITFYGKANGTVYFSVTGNDSTALINDPNHPFGSWDGVNRSLLNAPEDARNLVLMSAGRFPQLTGLDGSGNNLLPENTTYMGKGKPSESANLRTIIDTGNVTVITGDPKVLVSGISFQRMGFDAGQDVYDSLHWSGDHDCLVCDYAINQDPIAHPPVTGHVLKDVLCLGTPGGGGHIFLSENAFGCYGQNLTFIFNYAAGTKCWNSVYRQITSLGQDSGEAYAWFNKANPYSPAHDLLTEDVYIGPAVGTGAGALSRGAGRAIFVDAGPGLNNARIRGLVANTGTTRAAVEFLGGSITNSGATDVVLVDDATLGTLVGTGNVLSLAAAPTTSVTVTLDSNKTQATGVVLPSNSPQFIIWEINHGYIDSYTGAIDKTGIANGTVVTVRGRNRYGANGGEIIGTATFTMGASPDNTPPTVTFNPVGADGVTGTITPNEATTGSTGFLIRVNGILRPATVTRNSPTLLTYVLATPLYIGQSITGAVSSSTDIADLSGNRLEAASSVTIVNNSAVSAPTPEPGTTTGFLLVEGGLQVRGSDGYEIGKLTYTAGDSQPNLMVQFVDESGRPIDLTGAAVTVDLFKVGSDSLVVDGGECVIESASLGFARYTFGHDDLAAAGNYRMRFFRTLGGRASTGTVAITVKDRLSN